ncbi:UDP-N-acetylmuramate dehydrogenase [Micropruina sonneratiae]|uniref:UDP-N-acetylmuramate dehydrogenase n=1 Tax=Micropruina sonneratiae TaxID=2986940 RepID=UPI0022276B80|nr:UDP-N-acetylmuramate dehydrogenase [Micropruina sp. KQZ13P-5]MCW3158125.1 UDP-N-acetylmuramate dehydrogenase [Micropruina sp. KQZ13P-5]
MTETIDTVRLSDHTTLRVGGPARSWVTATTETELVDAVRTADAAGEPVLVLGGGSNLLIGDEGFDGTVIEVATRSIGVDGGVCSLEEDAAQCGGAIIKVSAGENWDDFVAYAIANQWRGVEALSGIPGTVGATPIQNVGAYGQEVSESIETVRTWDRATNQFRTFAVGDCGFGYRTSRFKSEPGRYVVLSVTFQFFQGALSMPLRFGELRRRLETDERGRAPMRQVREAVLALRRGKGMVLDDADHDTWSAGSFFTNPILTAEQAAGLPESAPRFPQPDGRVKSSAAWLIEAAGFHKGFGTPPATLSTKHTLALTNRGGASSADLVALARTVRDGVRDAFGVTLVPEPVMVGTALD